MKEIQSLPQSRFYRGPVSCVEWITREDDALETLAFGTGLGWFEIWREESAMVRSRISCPLSSKKETTGLIQ
jgi:hypothetical protein